MKLTSLKTFWTGLGCLAVFLVLTALICFVDVQAIGPEGSLVGFASLNGAFHALTGENMLLYSLTDLLELLCIGICLAFCVLGLVQWIKRKHLLRVDHDLLALGVFYVVVVACFLFFELVTINYRPVLIEGVLEGSYPSSTTLLVLSVMLSTVLQLRIRVAKQGLCRLLSALSVFFAVFMVAGRLLSGVHWLTDIVGSVLLSLGLFFLLSAVTACLRKRA